MLKGKFQEKTLGMKMDTSKDSDTLKPRDIFSRKDTWNENGHKQRFRHFKTKRHLYFQMPFL